MYNQVVEQYLSSLIDKPTLIWYHKDGSIELEQWYKDGFEYIPQKDSCHNKVVEIDGKKYKLTLID